MEAFLSQPWYIYVIGGVAIGLYVFRYFRQGMDEASNEPAEFNSSNSSDLSDQQKFSIALNAVLSSYWQVDTNTLTFTKNGKKPKQFDSYLSGWYIDTRDGYLNLTNYFLNDGRRGYFNFIYPMFKNVPREEWEAKMKDEYEGNDRAYKMLDTFDKHNVIDYLKSERIIEFDSDIEVGSIGWDISNLVGQARRAYTAQLISEQEAWEIIGKATEMAKQNFNSWDEFGKSLTIGFIIDMYKNKSQGDFYKEYLKYYRGALTDSNSPWNTISWQR